VRVKYGIVDDALMKNRNAPSLMGVRAMALAVSPRSRSGGESIPASTTCYLLNLHRREDGTFLATHARTWAALSVSFAHTARLVSIMGGGSAFSYALHLSQES